MGALRKEEKFPIQILALSQIVVSQDVQSRVATSLEYQREFSEAMLRGDVFPAVIVFYDGKKYWLADGFHRYGATKQASKVDRKFEGIKAEVREGTKRDAMIYSAGANIKFSIPRTSDDLRKSARMIFGFPEWWEKSDRLISKYIGCSQAFVVKHRAYYAAENGISLPESVTTSEGHQVPYGTTKGEPTVYKLNRKSGLPERYRVRFGNFTQSANSLEEAKEVAEKLKGWESIKRDSLATGYFIRYLGSRGIKVIRPEVDGPSLKSLDGLASQGCVLCTSGLGESETVASAVGRVLMLSQVVTRAEDHPIRTVVICYKEDADSKLIAAGEHLGVEFLTPDEFIASLKDDIPCEPSE